MVGCVIFHQKMQVYLIQSYKASTIIEGLKRPQMTLFTIAFYSMVAESSPEKMDPWYEEILSLPIANLISVHQPFDYDSKVIQSKKLYLVRLLVLL